MGVSDMAARKAAFRLTPIGPKAGRYDVSRVEGASAAPGAKTGGVKLVKEASARSKRTIQDIVRTHATGLKRLADR